MGRPNLTEMRTAEILDAFERCVARYGLENSSLELVAEEAGMKRSILRHYIGNRDDLIQALADRVVSKYGDWFQQALQCIPDENRTQHLLDFFFPGKSMDSFESVLVIEALIAASEKYPRIREQMRDYVEQLVTQTAELLSLEYPDASKPECWGVAYGVISICFNQDSLVPLQLPPKYLKAARSCAKSLMDSLET